MEIFCVLSAGCEKEGGRPWGRGKWGLEERKWKRIFIVVQSWAVPTILYLNPVHVTNEDKGADFIQLKGDQNT